MEIYHCVFFPLFRPMIHFSCNVHLKCKLVNLPESQIGRLQQWIQEWQRGATIWPSGILLSVCQGEENVIRAIVTVTEVEGRLGS